MAVWQPYRNTHVKGSQHDNFIVVSLTTLQANKWCQAFCCDGCGVVHKRNTQSKVNGLQVVFVRIVTNACPGMYVGVYSSNIKIALCVLQRALISSWFEPLHLDNHKRPAGTWIYRWPNDMTSAGMSCQHDMSGANEHACGGQMKN